MKSNTEYPRANKYLERLAESGRYHFTSKQAQEALEVSPDATKLALNRLIRQGLLATPARGFYLIVPPEYRSLGCLPADQFIPALMEHLGLQYYAGLLSAAQYYGAAHHRPQEFQVFVSKNRKPITCGKIRVIFIARKRIQDVPVRDLNTPRGTIHVSAPEATALDLVGYPHHAGGLDQVATILAELAEQIDPALLMAAALTVPITWVQRLGYLLELVGPAEIADGLKNHIHIHAREYTLLVPGNEGKTAPRKQDWKLIINAEVEPEL